MPPKASAAIRDKVVSEPWFEEAWFELGSWERYLWASMSGMTEDLASLSVKVSALEEALLEMSSKVEKVESDVRTLERHPLDELESLKTSVDTLQNSEEEGTESRHSLEEHAEHLRAVFKTLREKEKCSFVREEVHFLGHVIPHGTLRMDEKKVQAIKEWEPPTCVAELRSFLGLVNYYRPSIKGYSARAAPLTN